MAKAQGRKREVNKSQMIRDAYVEMGKDARPKDVVAALAAKDVKVTSGQVSTVFAALNKLKSAAPTSKKGKKIGTGKAQAIRDSLAKLGMDSRPRDIIADVKQSTGLQVSSALVSMTRNAVEKKSGKPQARPSGVRGPAGSKAARKPATAEHVSIKSLLATKDLIDEIGGIDAVHRALEVLSQLR